MLNVELKFLGVFSEFFGSVMTVKLKDSSSLVDLKKFIIEYVRINSIDPNLEILLNSSVFSNEHEILHESYVLKQLDVIYLLPPVSGG